MKTEFAAYCIVGVMMENEEFLAAITDGSIKTELDLVMVSETEYVFGIILSKDYLDGTRSVGVLDIDEFRSARREVEEEILHLSLDNLDDLAIYNFIGRIDDDLL